MKEHIRKCLANDARPEMEYNSCSEEEDDHLK